VRRPSGHPLVASLLDWAMTPMEHLRPDVVGCVDGDVLEIGVGTGLNLRHYPDVASWHGIEPDPHMRRRAAPRLQASGMAGSIDAAGAEALPFADASFDVVLATWVWCTIPEPEAAAREVRRVLRPGGRVVWIEHVGSDHPPMRWLQRGLDPLWTRLAGGCHLTRDPVALLESVGLAVDDVTHVGPQRWTPAPQRRGVATRR